MIEASEHPNSMRAEREPHLIESDHRALRVCGERLEGLIGRLAGGARSVEAEAQQLLGEFQRRLGVHLDAEERSGILERAAEAEPRFAGRVDQLLAAHRGLRESIAGLAEGLGSGADVAVFRSRFVSFKTMLQQHEQEESDILRRVYMEDIGGRG